MIRILAVGKNKDSSLRQLEKEYIKRVSPFTKIELLELKDEANIHIDRDSEIEKVKEKEGNRVLEKIGPQDFVILLDLHGKMMDSETFATALNTWESLHSRLVFVIAGSLGPSPALIRASHVRWKLSDLTFTHLMTRILVLEQIYRGKMIINHRPYHK
ncbi:MAG: 23S rRNA (pseudouridine(1915)-N(3))-methyltransferase RlmH [Erysipelotrichaceae bacterium]|nr:23S rRNA (pseudouridine(1915)-N(3))-methyltransferase RlmH [Erysipelotrichaceae bacterium]